VGGGVEQVHHPLLPGDAADEDRGRTGGVDAVLDEDLVPLVDAVPAVSGRPRCG
jgi:hypothetical protein